jgi:hypothetical protein
MKSLDNTPSIEAHVIRTSGARAKMPCASSMETQIRASIRL